MVSTQACSRDFVAGGAKTTKGGTFLKTILDVCSNRRTKHEMGGTYFKWGAGHHQRCSDSSFFKSDSSPDPRGRNPDPNPVCNTTMKSES